MPSYLTAGKIKECPQCGQYLIEGVNYCACDTDPDYERYMLELEAEDVPGAYDQ